MTTFDSSNTRGSSSIEPRGRLSNASGFRHRVRYDAAATVARVLCADDSHPSAAAAVLRLSSRTRLRAEHHPASIERRHDIAKPSVGKQRLRIAPAVSQLHGRREPVIQVANQAEGTSSMAE